MKNLRQVIRSIINEQSILSFGEQVRKNLIKEIQVTQFGDWYGSSEVEEETEDSIRIAAYFVIPKEEYDYSFSILSANMESTFETYRGRGRPFSKVSVIQQPLTRTTDNDNYHVTMYYTYAYDV